MKKLIVMIFCIGLTIICFIPFIILFVNSTKTINELLAGTTEWAGITNGLLASFVPGQNFSNNLNVLLHDVNLSLPRSFINSFVISASATVLTVYFSSLTAYAFTTYKFKGSKFLYGFILAVLMVPSQISIVAFIDLMYSFGWTESWRSFLPLIIPAIASPSTVFFMRQYMKSSVSLEMVEAGRIDGSGEFAIFNRLVIPIITPGMSTMAIFAMVASWNNLFMPTVLLNGEWRTIPIYVNQLLGNQFRTELGAIYLGLSLTILPLIVFYLLLSKYIVAGVSLGGVKE
ncbi:MAG: carbohydrate ABC transporter permease [Oscillospiraceae bacterium]|nr:carbohydrate ABC transporter permease [Oscillospiraceae bacterium]